MKGNRKLYLAYYAQSVAAIKRAAASIAEINWVCDSVQPSPAGRSRFPLYRTGERVIRKNNPIRIYFGAEFCQWRLPSPKALFNALAAAKKIGSPFTLLTPWVTDAGIDKLRKLFSVLKDEAPDSEVVINDLGALVLLRDEFPGLAPSLGRVLIRQRRCPRVPAMMENLPSEGREIYMRTGAEDPLSARLMRRYGIRRVELDYPLQGLETDLGAAKLKASLYTPYAFVTLTRHCPASFDGRTWQAFNRSGCKIKGCVKNILELRNSAHEAPLLMRGNAQFVASRAASGQGPALPDGIDRIVFMEDAP